MSNVSSFVEEFDRLYESGHTIENPQAQTNKYIEAIWNPAKMDKILLEMALKEANATSTTRFDNAYELNRRVSAAIQATITEQDKVFKYLTTRLNYSPVYALYRWYDVSNPQKVNETTNINASDKLAAAFLELQELYPVPVEMRQTLNTERGFDPLEEEILMPFYFNSTDLSVVSIQLDIPKEKQAELAIIDEELDLYHEFAHALDIVANPNILRYLNWEDRLSAISLRNSFKPPREIAELIDTEYEEFYSKAAEGNVQISLLTAVVQNDWNDIDITKVYTYATTALALYTGKTMVLDTGNVFERGLVLMQEDSKSIFNDLFLENSSISLDDLKNGNWKTKVAPDAENSAIYNVFNLLVTDTEVLDTMQAEIERVNQNRYTYVTDTTGLPDPAELALITSLETINKDALTPKDISWLLVGAFLSHVLSSEFAIEIDRGMLEQIYINCFRADVESFAQIGMLYIYLHIEATSTTDTRKKITLESHLRDLHTQSPSELDYITTIVSGMSEETVSKIYNYIYQNKNKPSFV